MFEITGIMRVSKDCLPPKTDVIVSCIKISELNKSASSLDGSWTFGIGIFNFLGMP